MSYYNPFQNLELRIPEAYRTEVDRYCQSQPGGGSRPSPDDSPFPRQVDLWFLAVCVGAIAGRPIPVEKPHRFINGEILSRDPFRIDLLELTAIAVKEDPWIIDKPADVMELANSLAASALPRVLEMLSTGNSKPIWNLTESLLESLPEGDERAPHHAV